MYKTIPNTNKLYEANKLGEIRRVKGLVANQPNGLSQRCVGGKTLSPKQKSSGYLEVSLSINRKRVSRYVHRLIAETFIGPIPKGYCVNHKNGEKTDNTVSNLEIVTFSQNSKHAIDNGYYSPPIMKGEAHPRAKLCDGDVYSIRKMRKEGKKWAHVAAMFPDVPLSTLYKVGTGQTWKHLSLN